MKDKKTNAKSKAFPVWLILALVCLVVAGVLGATSVITENPIALRTAEKNFASRQAAFPEADEFTEIATDEDASVDSCYKAWQNGKLAGYVAQVTVTGCKGPIEIQAGFDLAGNVVNITCGGSNFSETAGLGAKVKEESFRSQFSGREIPLSYEQEGLDAITGATVSSGAVLSGVNTAGYYVQELIHPSAQSTAPEDIVFNGVLPGATTKNQADATTGIDEIYTSDAGVVVYVTGQGRNGTIQVQVGIAHSGQVAGIYIDPAKHNETAGLGDSIENSYFWSQFLGKSGRFTAGENIDAISGATISSTAVIDCVNRALEAAEPYLDASKAQDISGWFSGAYDTTALVATKKIKADTKPSKVSTYSGITVLTAEEWKDEYPYEYDSWKLNEKNEETTDYVEDYPMISKVYEGMAFNTYYDSARGHAYTVTDITSTGRPHKLANCFTCKTPDFTVMVNNEGVSAYSKAFEDVLAEVSEPISCYNCHANTGDELVVTHTYLSDAMGDDFKSVDAEDLSCGQCHVEYYFSPATKATVLPYTSLDTMTPDSILAYYNNANVDGNSFADYTNPRTGVRQIKVQHPEFETFLGEGSVHKGDFTCADCHMADAVAADGTVYKSHYLISPLDNQNLIDNTCSSCHEDLEAKVRKIQEDMERRTYSVGYELEFLTDKLTAAVESGTYTEEELNEIRAIARDAQFYWDFVYVENSEGAHNSTLDNECLDKAETLLNQAMELFK